MKKIALALAVAVLLVMTGCQTENAEKEIDERISMKELYASDLFDDDDDLKRAVLSTEEGMVLIDEEGKYLSDVHAKIEASDIGKYEDVIRYQDYNGKYGYISIETGDVVIEAKCDNALPFSGELSFVEDDKGWKIINQKGEKASDLCFEDVTCFDSQGTYARVQYNSKWGVIDYNAKIVVPFEFDYINELPDVLTVATGVKNGSATILYSEFDVEWEQVVLEEYCEISEMHIGLWAEVTDSQNKVGIVNASGNLLIEPQYKSLPTYMWYGDDEFVITTQGFTDRYGAVYLKDNKAYDIIPQIYDNELRFSSDKVAIAYKNGLPGIVDCISHEWTGMFADYIDIDAYKGNLARIHMDEQYGFLYANGKYATEPNRYVYAEEFSNGRGYTVVGDGIQKGLIDRELNEIIPCVYDEIFTFDNSNYVIVKNEGKYTILYMREGDFDEYEAINVLDGIGEIKNNEIYVNSCTIKVGNKWYVLKLERGFIDKKIPVEKGECSKFYTL